MVGEDAGLTSAIAVQFARQTHQIIIKPLSSTLYGSFSEDQLLLLASLSTSRNTGRY
jgi:hypothetical protein